MNGLNIFSSKEDQEKLQQVYKSSIRASYFNHMGNNKFTQKSKIQIDKSAEQDEVNENTFRIMRKFNTPEQSYMVINQNGSVSTESSGGFFACFGRKQFEASLRNTVLTVRMGGKWRYYFDFDVVNAQVSDRNDRFQIKLKTINKNFDFYPLNKPLSRDWTQSIQQAIKNSDGKKNENEQICKIPQFYKKPYIHYKEFEKVANTGDIILFRSEHSAARAQQLFLNSQYDHVAVVLRNKKNELVLYESSSFEGVGFTQWRHMIKYEWYKSTQKIAWKKLNFNFQNHHFDIVQNFVVNTLGKQFDISLQKIFSFQSKMKRQKSQEDAKTYFCSQLVARMYKQLGLLDPEVSCTQYYPVTFSDSGSLKFTDSRASLNQQYLIAF